MFCPFDYKECEWYSDGNDFEGSQEWDEGWCMQNRDRVIIQESAEGAYREEPLHPRYCPKSFALNEDEAIALLVEAEELGDTESAAILEKFLDRE